MADILQEKDKTLIMKFGGSVLRGPSSFSKIANLVGDKKHIVIVASAMHGMTSQLSEMAKAVMEQPPKREMDMLISVGERISISLLAMAFAKIGREAISFTGSQSGVITTDQHQEARIIDMRPARLIQALDQGKVVIVAGFQGVSLQKEITTLGRGGSDTTAVALAIALRGTLEFVKDVPGIYRDFPKKEDLASILTYDEALEIVAKTGGVLHPRALQLAEKNGLPLCVRGLVSSSKAPFRFDHGGTLIRTDKPQTEPIYEEPLPTHHYPVRSTSGS